MNFNSSSSCSDVSFLIIYFFQVHTMKL
jgi:hypothetical protein